LYLSSLGNLLENLSKDSRVFLSYIKDVNNCENDWSALICSEFKVVDTVRFLRRSEVPDVKRNYHKCN